MRLIPAAVQRGVESFLDPPARRLIAWRVSPNAITTVGTMVIVGSGVAFGLGQIQLGGGLLLLSGLGDMLDGKVARLSGGVTTFGAFYDSTLDRIGECALFAGIAVFFMQGGLLPEWRVWGVLLALLALSAGLTVSYARARAEGLGLECKVGFAQRAERILGVGIPCLFVGAGPNGWLLFWIVTVLAVLASITVVQRIAHVYGQTQVRGARRTEARRIPELAETHRERT
ncbi:MAG: CDP-alcohol phosphatidyltransferase family protein [Gemmatimonadales bacterium]